MQLDRTVIIPIDDPALAKSLFKHIIDEEPILLLVVLGDDDTARRAVKLADKLAAIEIQGFKRKVVWIRDVSVLESEICGLREGRARLTSADLSQVLAFSLNLADQVMDTIGRDEPIDFVRLDRAFMRPGGTV